MPTPPPDLLARIDRLDLDARQVVEGYLAGRHRSPRHGFAVEFAQHREYAPGDDLRHLDWKVFARTERYHLKQYEQETNLVAWLLVDASESMRVGTVRRPDGSAVAKFDVAATLAAALAHLVTGQADSVGLQILDATRRPGLKASGSTGRVRDVVRQLAGGPGQGTADVGKGLLDLGGSLGRRAVVFLFSDLLDDPAGLAAGLRVLRAHRHEAVVFQVLDAAELDFPFRHPTLFRGLEGEPELNTDPLSIRDGYLKAFGEHLAAVDEVCRVAGADVIRVRTDDDLGAVLATYLRKRSA